MRTIDADALIEKCGDWYVEEGPEEGFIGTIKRLIDAQPAVEAPDINVGNMDAISRQAAIDKFIDGLETIFSDIREREVDDSVCGLCEYDGAYIGQSGDWCNECPGFDRDDCFKLSDKIRKEWTDEIIKALPSAQPYTTTHDFIPAETGKNDGDGTSGDCISRQRAIEAFETAAKSGASIEDIKLILSEMPLVQSSIIRCKDCKYYKYGICMKIGANKSFHGFCDWAERGEQE